MTENCLRLIGGDLRAKSKWFYGENSRSGVLKALLTDGTLAMILYRLMQASHRAHLGPLAMIFNKLNAIFGSCVIGRGADFGPRLVLIHSHGIVINSLVRGGQDLKIEHQVTIGAEQGLSPLLGDDIFLGSGAKILGAVHVGSRVRVGANAVVIKDVPDDSTAVGVPARYILHSEKTRPKDVHAASSGAAVPERGLTTSATGVGLVSRPGSENRIASNTGQSVGALINGDRPLCIFAEREAGHSQCRCLLLDAAGICQHQGRRVHEAEELKVAERI